MLMISRVEDLRRREMTSVAKPLISIITVVFNAREDLPGLIESVALFKNEKVEFIVIDGGSKDGTCELLSQHNSIIDFWVSEPDNGLYDAMNKGIAVARGTYLFHLNAGDRLLRIPFRELETAASQNTDVVAFRVSIDDVKVFCPRRGIALRLTNTLHHQGTFYKREAFPLYETNYRVFADFDANQRLARSGASIEIHDQVVASHQGGGLSDAHTQSNVREFFHVIKSNYGWTHLPLAWLICKWSGIKTRFSMLRRRF